MAIADSLKALKENLRLLRTYWWDVVEEWWSVTAESLGGKVKDLIFGIITTWAVLASRNEGLAFWDVFVAGAAGVVATLFMGFLRAQYRVWVRQRVGMACAVMRHNGLISATLTPPKEVAAVLEMAQKGEWYFPVGTVTQVSFLNYMFAEHPGGCTFAQMLESVCPDQTLRIGALIGVGGHRERLEELLNSMIENGLITVVSDSLSEHEYSDDEIADDADDDSDTKRRKLKCMIHRRPDFYCPRKTGLHVWRWSLVNTPQAMTMNDLVPSARRPRLATLDSRHA